MGDNLGAEDKVAAARRLEDLGCDFVIHHIGYDERRGLGRGRQTSPKSARSASRYRRRRFEFRSRPSEDSPSNKRSARRSMERLSW